MTSRSSGRRRTSPRFTAARAALRTARGRAIRRARRRHHHAPHRRAQQLCHKGDAAAQVYVVASGRLKVTSTSAEGDEVMLNLLDVGEVIGELPLLIGGQRTATVVALEPSELVVLERRDFLRFLREHPDAASELLTVLAERVVRLSECIEDIAFLGVAGRIAKKLLALAENFGETEFRRRARHAAPVQSELAQYVGTTRETVNKQIRSGARRACCAWRPAPSRFIDSTNSRGSRGS